jgi:hypothetical protein
MLNISRIFNLELKSFFRKRQALRDSKNNKETERAVRTNDNGFAYEVVRLWFGGTVCHFLGLLYSISLPPTAGIPRRLASDEKREWRRTVN